jgi:ubiquinol-cytochrome c reductase cytochrome c subunit
MRKIARQWLLVIPLLITALSFAISGSAAAQKATTPASGSQAGDIERGRKLFMADGCYECHGTVGQGGFAGPRLAPNPLPADAIAQYIRNPKGVMPPYIAKVVSDRDVADLRAYLASIPPPPALKDIPLLAR